MAKRETSKSVQGVESTDRTLPHNLEAERSVLGAILMHNDAYQKAVRYVRGNDFFRDAHRRLFDSMDRLLDRPDGFVDLVTLKEDLGNRGELDTVGGPAYITSLTDGVPRSTNVEHYAKIVQDKSLLRQIIFTSNKTLTDAYIGEDPAHEVLARADQAIVNLQYGHSAGHMARLSSQRLFEDLEWRQAHRGQLTGVPCGFPSIDALTNGWQPGDLIVLAARPSMGKTTLLMNAITNGLAVSRKDGGKRRGAIFSMEMRREQLEMRMLSSLSQVPLSVVMGGWVSSDESWKAISDAIGKIDDLSIFIDDTSARTVRDIRAECRRLRSDGGLDLVAVDYVQLMSGTSVRKGATRTEEMTEISRSLKILAGELGVPVIILSQLRRTQGSRPQLEDLRESGSLEQDADVVGFIHRKDHRESGVSNFILAKQRNGPTGTVNITIDRDTVTFTDGGDEPAAPAEPEKSDAEKAAARTRAIIRNRAKGR